MITGVNNGGCDNFNTPQHFFDQLNEIFNFTVDAACSSENSKVKNGYFADKGIDGLLQTWTGERVFCNPPFSKKAMWIKKAHRSVQEEGCPIVVMVLPVNCMSTETFFNIVIKNNYMFEVVQKRLEFLDDITKERASGNNSGTVVVFFKKDLQHRPSKR